MNDAATAKAFTDLDRAEGKLLRAFNKWAKCKAKVKRMDKAYAKTLAESLPGKMDVRQMPIEAKPWPKGKGKPKVKPLKSR